MITLGYQISSQQGGPVFNLVFVQICLHFLSSFLFGPNRLHGTISSRQSGIPTVQKRYPALSRKTYVVVGYNLRRILVLPVSQKNRTDFRRFKTLSCFKSMCKHTSKMIWTKTCNCSKGHWNQIIQILMVTVEFFCNVQTMFQIISFMFFVRFSFRNDFSTLPIPSPRIKPLNGCGNLRFFEVVPLYRVWRNYIKKILSGNSTGHLNIKASYQN